MSLSTKEYFIRETYKSIKRNGLMSLASVSTVALSLLVLGMFLLIFINTNNLAQYLESQVQRSVSKKLFPDLRNGWGSRKSCCIH